MTNKYKFLIRIFTVILFSGICGLAIGQKSYITPHGQFIKIYNGGEKWEYIETPNYETDQDIIRFNFEKSRYDTLIKHLYFQEADCYANYISTKFINDQKESLNSTDREKEKKYLEKNKEAISDLETILNTADHASTDFKATFIEIEKKWLDANKTLEDNGLQNFTIESKKDADNKNEPQVISSKYNSDSIDEAFKTEENEVDFDNLNFTHSNSLMNRNEEKKKGYVFEIDDRPESELVGDHLCQLIYNGFDESLGKYRKETSMQKLFTYTHPKLMRNFKKQDFLTGEASIIKTGETFYLSLKTTIKSKDARRSYGHIEQGAMLRITLISGKKMFLKNRVNSTGTLQAFTGNTLYQCFYELDKDNIQDLSKNEVDKVGIMWTTGFEDYPIYHIDFFKNQIKCIEDEITN